MTSDLEPEEDTEPRSTQDKALISMGITSLFIVLLNLSYGLGNIISRCKSSLHPTCSTSKKLNWLEIGNMDHWEAWSPTGSLGIPDIFLIIVSAVFIVIGVKGLDKVWLPIKGKLNEIAIIKKNN